MAPALDDVMAALCMAALAGAVLVAYMHSNRAGGADHFWRHTHRPTYAVMKMCQVVVAAAIAYNARFVLTHLYQCVKARWAGRRTRATRSGRASVVP